MVEERAVTKRGPVDIEEVSRALGGQALSVSPQYVESTVRSLTLLQELVHKVLVRGRDYGRVPGLPEFLWDPGASTIIASFNCHVGQRRILSLVDDGRRLSVVIEVPLIHNIAQIEVGSGIGAATVAETKNKYRWEPNPEDYGYSEEEIKKLETRERYDRTQYKIFNPEPSELLNTIIKIASKRAEVDAAEGLPGAASALRELLDPDATKSYKPSNANRPGESGIGDDSPRWTAFWTQAKALLETEAEKQGIELSALTHKLLGVTSMKDWVKKGKSLDDAIRLLAKKINLPNGEELGDTGGETLRQGPTTEELKNIRDATDQAIKRRERGGELKDTGAPLPANILFHSWKEVAEAITPYGLYPSDVFKRSGYARWEDFPSFQDAWNTVIELVNERRQKDKLI